MKRRKYPYLFLDKDTQSITYQQWCVRIDGGTSYDGYTKEDARRILEELKKEKQND